MSAETLESLNNNTLIGYTDRRGEAWHYRADMQGAESNHYQGAIPTEDVYRRLFHWTPLALSLRAKDDILTDEGVTSVDIVDPTRLVIVRPDTMSVLGVFRDSYQVHPYRETLVELTQQVVGHGMGIGSAGLLKGGAVGWVQFEMTDTESHAGVDYRPFVTATTSLDGTLASQWIRGSQVVVCDNTLSAALGESNKLKVSKKHTKWSLQPDSWEGIREELQLSIAEAKEAFQRQVEILTNTPVSDGEWAKFLDAHFGEVPNDEGRARTRLMNRNNALTAMWLNDPRCAPWHGNAYGVLSTVNTFTHHNITPRGDGKRGDVNALRAIKTNQKGETEIDQLDRSVITSLNTVFKNGRKKAIAFA